MQVGTLGSYKSVTVAKLKTMASITHHRKKGKSYFENGGKAHDTGVIQGNIAVIPKLKESK